jgi:Insertion element 4 transposase N-terminal/Transposase DDE domain
VQLKEFSLINPKLEASLVFQAIQTVISPEIIDQELEKSNRVEKRQRKLPASLVVCLVIAMSFWSSDSMATVLKNLVNGLNRQWTKLGKYWITPNSSSISDESMLLMWDRGLHSYRMVNATITQGCHYLGRVPANVKFPAHKILEDGSYLSWIHPDRKSQKKGCSKIQVRVIEYTIETDGEIQTYRLITSLMDLALFPALLLAQQYHQRWEIENTIDELKTHLLGRKTPIRSLKPREVVPEIYGWLLGHYAIRSLMFQAAQQANISPWRLGFTGTLKVIRRAIGDFQDLKSEQLPFFSHG